MKASILIFAHLFAVSMAYRTSKQRYEGLSKLERENLDPGSQNLITTPPTTLTFAPSYAPTNSTTHALTMSHHLRRRQIGHLSPHPHRFSHSYIFAKSG